MYITDIELDQVRCFEKVRINLGDSRTSLMIAGNNGIGKSALLRSIAMGLCDQASAGGLLRELPGDFIRKTDSEETDKHATIKISLRDDDDEYVISTSLEKPAKFHFENVATKISKNGTSLGDDGWKEFEWNKIFVAAYGAGLRTEANESYSRYFAPDAVYSLFKYSHSLQDPWSAWSSLVQAARDNADDPNDKADQEEAVNAYVSTILKKALLLKGPDDSITLEPNGIFVKIGHQIPVELGGLGDGLRAITTIILDFLSWQLLKQNRAIIERDNPDDLWGSLDQNELEGIVIIDEIEKHLHPQLQREVILRLNELFPNVQFIVSSHSPLCLAGTADVISGNYKIHKIFVDNEQQVRTEERAIPQGLRTDQILVDYFDVPTTLNISLASRVERYRTLSIQKFTEDNLSTDEIDELATLEIEIAEISPPLAEREDDRKIEREMLELARQVSTKVLSDD